MGTTTGGLPYPEPTDLLANVDLALKALAEAVIGPLTNSNTGFVAATGWTVGTFRGVKIGTRFAWVDLTCTRTGATLTAGSAGNLADTDVVTVPATWRPTRRQHLSGHRSGLGIWQTHLEPSGVLVITAGPPTASIDTAATLQVQALLELT